ncbi:hypothetical protein BC940DRAFT_301913 [Gongronella butleri]|nr:hypothetical protein BC940DRAFT_301913 [Gongronella butleri]
MATGYLEMQFTPDFLQSFLDERKRCTRPRRNGHCYAQFIRFRRQCLIRSQVKKEPTHLLHNLFLSTFFFCIVVLENSFSSLKNDTCFDYQSLLSQVFEVITAQGDEPLPKEVRQQFEEGRKFTQLPVDYSTTCCSESITKLASTMAKWTRISIAQHNSWFPPKFWAKFIEMAALWECVLFVPDGTNEPYCMPALVKSNASLGTGSQVQQKLALFRNGPILPAERQR